MDRPREEARGDSSARSSSAPISRAPRTARTSSRRSRCAATATSSAFPSTATERCPEARRGRGAGALAGRAPHPVYVGFGTYDAETKPGARALAARVRERALARSCRRASLRPRRTRGLPRRGVRVLGGRRPNEFRLSACGARRRRSARTSRRNSCVEAIPRRSCRTAGGTVRIGGARERRGAEPDLPPWDRSPRARSSTSSSRVVTRSSRHLWMGVTANALRYFTAPDVDRVLGQPDLHGARSRGAGLDDEDDERRNAVDPALESEHVDAWTRRRRQPRPSRTPRARCTKESPRPSRRS